MERFPSPAIVAAPIAGVPAVTSSSMTACKRLAYWRTEPPSGLSYVFAAGQEIFPGQEQTHRNGGGVVTLRSENMKEGVGFKATGRQYETAVVLDGKVQPRRITSTRQNTPTLVVARIIWGKDGENDSFVPFPQVGPDLKLPRKRAVIPSPSILIRASSATGLERGRPVR